MMVLASLQTPLPTSYRDERENPRGSSTSVTVIAPCRNEVAHVTAFCRGVLTQRLPDNCCLQLLVADGGSNDGTRELLATLASNDPRIGLIENPQQIVSAGLNGALNHATGRVIVRMDVHTEYANDYVLQCLEVLAETSADNVGGAWRAEPLPNAGPMQHAVAAAFQSKWVAGGALSRLTTYSGWVDTVYLGCWPRATFERFGNFDESLVRNQDDEYNLRIVRGGGRIWQSSRIRSWYRPRASLMQVFRQYLQYGYWKPFVMRKHGQAAALRHLVPGVFMATVLLLVLAALLGAPSWPLVVCLSLYTGALAGLTCSIALQGKHSFQVRARIPLVIAAYHVGYGIGSIAGWWDVFRHGKGRARFSTLTR